MNTDHADAWDLAHFKQEGSNLARCYIDLRKAAQAVLNGDNINGINRLREIEATAADSTVKAING